MFLWAAVQNMVRTVNKIVEGKKIVESHQVLTRMPTRMRICVSTVSSEI